MISPEQVETLIKAKLPDAQIQALTNDGEHYEVIVVSSEFEGKGRVQQHQIVYGAVQQEMNSGILHAMSLRTYTPQTWISSGQTV
jgi:acid stress-induced BolA-like protein IbaG/YrbA